MNALSLRACGRILWREAAEQYAFCIGMFALLITMQASLATMESFDMIRPPTVAFGFGMALFMTAIYAAASCALMLTAETHAGPFTFQRTRPVGWLTYLWGKLSWVVASTLLLGIVSWLETSVWLGVFPSTRDTAMAFGVSGVGIMEGLAWGLMAAMLVREPLRAVVAGIAMASLAAWITVVIHHAQTGGGTVAVTTAYYNAALPRLIVAVVVFAAGLRLVRVWYRTGQPLRPWARPAIAQPSADSAAAADAWNTFAQPSQGRATRLVWHAWRQIRTPSLIYWGLCLATMAFLCFAGNVGNDESIRGVAATTSFAFVGLSAFLSGYTFGADQKARFLQLARDGVSPWEIWLSRLAVMAAVLLPPAVFLHILYWFAFDKDNMVIVRPLASLVIVLGYVSVLTIGQACSMYIRSRIVALLAAPVAIACFAFWLTMGVFWAGLGWQLGVVPLLVALLIGSRLLTGTRLRQDNSWRAMRVPLALVAIAVVFTFRAYAHHRVSEVRPYDSITPVESRLNALAPHRSMVTTPPDIKSIVWDKSPQEQFEYYLGPHFQLFSDPGLQASDSSGEASMVASMLRSVWHANSGVIPGRGGQTFAGSYGNLLIAEAGLDRALRQAASQPEVNNDRLHACIDFLEDWPTRRTRHSQWLAVDWQRDMAWLQFGRSQGSPAYGYRTNRLPWQYRWLWFERTRTVQILDRAYGIAIDRAEAYETALVNDQIGAEQGVFGFSLVSNPSLITSQDILPYDPSRSMWYQMSNHMILESTMWEFPELQPLVLTHWQRYDTLYTAEAQRRGTILYLALRMYYNDNGELPDSLQELVKEGYLDRLPLVPILCRPFHYEPHGTGENSAVELAAPNAGYSLTGQDTSFLFQHDSTLPFLWYPWMDKTMDPNRGSGMFIDLDFVKKEETQTE